MNHDGGHRAHTQALRPTRDLRVMHIEHGHLTRGTGDPIDEAHCFFTRGASRAKNLHGSFGCHQSYPFTCALVGLPSGSCGAHAAQEPRAVACRGHTFQSDAPTSKAMPTTKRLREEEKFLD